MQQCHSDHSNCNLSFHLTFNQWFNSIQFITQSTQQIDDTTGLDATGHGISIFKTLELQFKDSLFTSILIMDAFNLGHHFFFFNVVGTLGSPPNIWPIG